jgi:hypothetical protein
VTLACGVRRGPRAVGGPHRRMRASLCPPGRLGHPPRGKHLLAIVSARGAKDQADPRQACSAGVLSPRAQPGSGRNVVSAVAKTARNPGKSTFAAVTLSV